MLLLASSPTAWPARASRASASACRLLRSQHACSAPCTRLLSSLAASHRLSVWHALRKDSPAASASTPVASETHPGSAPSNPTAGKPKAPEDPSMFWHSASHLLGWALETKYGDDCMLADGPPTATGFFYDALLVKDGERLARGRIDRLSSAPSTDLFDTARIDNDIKQLLAGNHGGIYHPSDDDLPALTTIMNKLAAQKAPFECLDVTRDEAARMFAYSPLKLAFLAKIPAAEPVTLYKCGDFIDLCRGPHVRNTGVFRSIKLTHTGASQWRPNSPQNLSRVYGVAFSSRDGLKAWEKLQEEAAKRDHRLVGKQQSLFYFSPLSPGAPFFLPHGTRIMQRLIDFLRNEYRQFGFEEVVTPLVFNKALWEQSGHWQNYQEDMFAVTGCCGGAHDHHETDAAHDHVAGPSDTGDTKQQAASKDVQALKPMNCPGHCVLYDSTARSYRELPLRYAEFSPLHRNEASGALTGLTRVRKFHQDDGHIFCTPEQVASEIKSQIAFIDRVYKIFQFPSYELALSTRPETSFVGELSQWDAAESALRQALASTGREWTIKEGDGAFYGPKIDIAVRDALGRKHQTATIQLDFQLPTRFKLQYQNAEGGFGTPVMIHRAVLGSIERMLAILIEHYGGRWPFWLSPRQAVVVPTRPDLDAYAVQVQQQLLGMSGASPNSASGPTARSAGNGALYHIDVDRTDNQLGKRIRDAQAAQYNYILVVGDKERDAGTVSVRSRSGEQLGAMPVAAVMDLFAQATSDFQ
ncbi:hypothetical protein BC831DRAFT_465785 [Entophlyctis helioformis]|nr:hypothetical protein BC831DRAFT_465785 [Entophlyctis helioformis]